MTESRLKTPGERIDGRRWRVGRMRPVIPKILVRPGPSSPTMPSHPWLQIGRGSDEAEEGGQKRGPGVEKRSGSSNGPGEAHEHPLS